MKKLILCTSVAVCMAVCRNSMGDVNEYNCNTGDCLGDEGYSGSSCTCDGYAMAINPEYTCTTSIDCAYDYDDTEYAQCHNGWCARVIRNGYSCADYQYAGEYYGTEGLFDNTCYNCPTYATCDGFNMECDIGYYRVYLGTNQQVVDPNYHNALVLGCQKCPAGASVDATTSEPGATDITDCYVTGGTDNTGTFIYTSECYYEE